MTQSITICLIASALIVQAQTPTTLTEFTAAAAGPTFLMQASNGNFYGITGLETQNSAYTIYTMTPSGATTALVGATGWNPVSLLQTSDGNFYGSSPYTNDGGIVFKMTPAGAVSTVHQFNGGRSESHRGTDPGDGRQLLRRRQPGRSDRDQHALRRRNGF